MKQLILATFLCCTVTLAKAQGTCNNSQLRFLCDSLMIKSVEFDIDISLVAFKAQLLTASNFGLADSQLVMTDLLSQTIISYKYPILPNFIFMEIYHGQKYYFDYTLSHYGVEPYSFGCRYLITYNISNATFYKLSGFGVNNYDLFKSDSHLKKGDELLKILTELEKEKDQCDCGNYLKGRVVAY